MANRQGSDYGYLFTWYPKHFDSQAARQAVLYPLYPSLTNLPPEQLQRATLEAAQDLLERWRLRASLLCRAGYKILSQRKNLAYVRNCWPGGMVGLRMQGINNAGRLCGLPAICPWCAGRRAAQVYQAATRARPHPGGFIRTGEEYACWARSVVHNDRHAHGDSLDEILRLKMLQLKHLTRYNMARGILLGGYMSVALCPIFNIGMSETGQEIYRFEGWRSQTRLLGLIQKNTELESLPQGWDSYGEPGEHPTNRALLSHVGRACRYPSPLMVGDPLYTSQILEARAHKRLSEFVGSFRKQVTSENYTYTIEDSNELPQPTDDADSVGSAVGPGPEERRGDI